ncbi:sulfatase-like hydrolase/transferase [soil metagenome]
MPMNWLLKPMIAAAVAAGCAGLAHAAPPRPNVLFILSDDQRFDTIHALGNAEIITPNLDKLVARGFNFKNVYCQGGMVAAVCSPSRSMLMTGLSIFHTPEWDDKKFMGPTLGGEFTKAGYATLYAGKKSNSFIAGNEAFSKCIYTDAGLIETDKPAEDSIAAQQPKIMADAALDFLHADHGGAPTFVFLAPHYPHDPRVAPKKFNDLYDPAKISLPPNFMPRHPFDNGDMNVRDELLAKLPRDPDEMKRHIADYYASISWLDEEVGRVLDDLKQRGQLDNTIIIYTSDQGLAVGGRHGLMGKQNLYEEFKSPLIIAGPGVPHGDSAALVYLFDLFPTLCGMAGIDIPKSCEGVNLQYVMKGEGADTRPVLFAPYKDVQRMVRDERWKLISYPKIGRFQLFDLKDDPWEIHDLADDRAHEQQLNTMKSKLTSEQARWDDPQVRK